MAGGANTAADEQNPFAADSGGANPFHVETEEPNPFGEQTTPDISAIKGHIQKNLSAYGQKLQEDAAPEGAPPPAPPRIDSTPSPSEANPFGEIAPSPAPQAPSVSGDAPIVSPPPGQKKPPTFLDAVEAAFNMSFDAVRAGYQSSTTGLLIRGKAPDFELPRDAPAFFRIASQVSSMAADLPEYFTGGLLGTLAGTAVAPGVGTLAGAAGAFALPATMRSILMDHYTKGDIKTFSDFWERSSAALINGLEQGGLGVATAGVGGLAGKALAPLATPAVTTAGVMASQVATMVGLGNAMQGKVPDLEDFGDAAAAVLLMHGATGAFGAGAEKVQSKLQDVYAKTGVKPEQVANQAVSDPLLRQELMADGNKLPTIYGPFEEKIPPTWYHGTKSDIQTFEPKWLGLNTGSASAKEGFFFTDNPDVATQYADIADHRGGAEAKLLVEELSQIGDPYGIHNENYLKPGIGETFHSMGDSGKLTPENLVKRNPELDLDKAEDIVDAYKTLSKRITDLHKEWMGAKEPHQDSTLYPVHLDMQNPLEKDYEGQSYRDEKYVDVIKQAKADGHDGVIFKNTFDNPYTEDGKPIPPHNVAVAFDPDQIQFKHALPPITRNIPKVLTENHPTLTEGPEDHITIEPVSKSVLESERGAVGSKSPEEPQTDLGKAMKDILDHVHSRPDSKSEPLTPDRLYEGVVDGLDPFRSLVKDMVTGEKLPASEDPYKLARIARNAVDKAQAFIKYGPFEFGDNTKVTGPGMNEILAPFKSPEERAKLTAFLVANRSLELEQKGITAGSWKSESSKTVYEALKDKYAPAAERLTNFENQALGYLRDSGRISAESYNRIAAESKNHVPFYRITDQAEAIGGTGRGGPKRIKGAESDIVDPIESIVRNVHEYMRMAEANRAAEALVNLTQDSEEGRELVKPAETKLKPVAVSPAETSQYLRSYGLDEATPGVVEGMTVFRPVKSDLGENQIIHYVDGKANIYDTPPDIARAFRAMDGRPGEMNFVVKLLKGPASLLRSTLAYTPDFIARHYIRNQVVAQTFSTKYSGIPILENLRALGHLFAKDDVYQDFLRSGGGNGAIVAIDQNYVEKNVWELSKSTGLIDSMQNLVAHPLSWLHAGATLMDNASRLAEFKRVAGENPTHEDLVAGGYAAREVIPDPLRRGSDLNVRAWDMITPFSNLRIQGLDKIARAFKESPVQTTARVGALVTLPSVLLWMAHQSQMQSTAQTAAGGTYKERWENIPEIQKDLAWIVMTDNHTFRIPKPFELGILFGSLTERILDAAFAHNPDAFKNFGSALIGGATPGVIPTGVSPFVEQFANKSTFTNHSIIPGSMEKLLPQDQATPYTTDSAKLLGGILQKIPVIRDLGPDNAKITSPMILENYVRAWSGNLGMYALKAADQALIAAKVVPDPVRPADKIEDMPFVKAFMIRNPSAGAQQIQDFYDNDNAHQTMIAHRDYLLKKGDVTALKKDFGPDQPENQEKLVSLAGFRTALSSQNAFIQKVTQNPNMSPVDKRQIIDKTLWGMIRMATQANELLKSIHDGKSPKGSNP